MCAFGPFPSSLSLFLLIDSSCRCFLLCPGASDTKLASCFGALGCFGRTEFVSRVRGFSERASRARNRPSLILSLFSRHSHFLLLCCFFFRLASAVELEKKDVTGEGQDCRSFSHFAFSLSPPSCSPIFNLLAQRMAPSKLRSGGNPAATRQQQQQLQQRRALGFDV
ncbi:hypothetical protein IWZ00DRAFT_13119 [Phyllosticta capitalensis]|uniref:Secreted protein n=1 Tax=Phyllosticta capitalensis TaxID=121624 RepID=A0ABR1Z286_9PEZI